MRDPKSGVERSTTEALGSGLKWPWRGGGEALACSQNWLLFGMCFAAALAAHFPGNVTFDGIVQWYEGRHGVHFSQHPPAMALLLRYCDAILQGPGLFTVLQLFLLWISAWCLVAWARPRAVLAVVFYVGLFCLPPVFALEGVVAKDILGGNLVLLACMVAHQARRKTGFTLLWPASFALIGLAMLVRYQFGIVILPAGLSMLLQARGHGYRRGLVLCLSCALAFLGVAGVVTAAVKSTMRMDSTPYNERNVGANDTERSLRKMLVFDIAGAVANDPATALTDMPALPIPEAALKRRILALYTPAKVDTLWAPGGIFEPLRGVPTPQILAQWRAVIWQSPLALVEHRVKAFGRVLGLGDIYACSPIFAGISANPPQFAEDLHSGSYRPALSRGLLMNRAFPVRLTFPPIIYDLVCAAIICLTLAGFRAAKAAVLLASAGLIYQATFFFLPQACDVRYSYFTILTAVFGAAMTVFLSFPAQTATWQARQAGGRS